jgi:hypothetical protein
MRDIRKEGLTKPRILLKIMLEELKFRYPDLKAFECPEFWDSYIVDGVTPPRGHGLGMANALTTLMQIAIAQQAIEHSDQAINPTECDFAFYNDDFIASFDSEEAMEIFLANEQDVFLGLGLIMNKEKSFWS